MKKLFFLLMTVVCALLYAPPIHAWTVYLSGVNETSDGKPKVYLWDANNGDAKLTGDFPGKAMEAVPGATNTWALTGTGTPTNVIFSKGNDQNYRYFNGNGTFHDGFTYEWTGSQNQAWPKYLYPYTIYIKDESGQDKIYLHLYNCTSTDPSALTNWNNPGETQQINLESRKVGADTYKMTFKVEKGSGEPKLLVYTGSSDWQTPGDGASSTTLEDGKLYTVTSSKQLNVSEYNPAKVTKAELIKDGSVFRTATATYGADGKLAPIQFTLASLTGTGVYTINVTCSDGTTETVTKYFGTHPTDSGSPLAVADRDNTFQLNAKNSSKIIASATMSVNFDGITATDYTLTGVQYLSHVAKVYLTDGTTDWEMEHRQDGKYVLAGFSATTGTKYAVKVMLPNTGDTGYQTTLYGILGNATIVDHIRDAKEITSISSDGFTFGTTGPTNVSVRLVRGQATKISLGDNNGFYTIYFRKPFADWAPYVRLSSSETTGYWWRRMASVNGRPDLYYITFDPHLYNRVRFFSNDYFDIPESQTERVEAVDGKLYTVNGSNVVTTGEADKIGRPLSSQTFSVPYTVTEVKLVNTNDASKSYPLSLDAVGNWTATLTSEVADGSYLIEVTATQSNGTTEKKNYNVSGALTAGTGGSTTVSESSTPFTIQLNGATQANLSLAMSDNGCVPVSVSLIDPNAGITSVKMVRRDGEQTYVFTSSDDGMTWTWEGIGLKSYNDGESSIDKSYQLEVVNSGSTQKWYYDTDNYGFNKDETYSGNWKSTAGTQRFRFRGSDNDLKNETQIVITLTDDKTGIKSLRYASATAPTAPNIYMPLTEVDFAAGPRYFLVGTRTADWRLQPEWELKPDGNGNVTLSGRLMYQQLFAIAKVENYANYTAQQYTIFSNNYDVKKDYCTDIPLSSYGSAEAIRYDKATGDPHPYNDRLRWKVDREDWNADSWTQTSPILLKKVTVKLENGNPKTLSFDYSDNATDIGQARTLSLTGENIRYQGDFTFSDGRARNMALMTPGSHLTRNDNDPSDRWGNAWVQTDANGRPYVDGNGDLVYNTAFDSEWLSKHSVRFYNKAQDLEYTSLNTTFLPAEQIDEDVEEFKALYKMHPLADGKGYNRIGGGEERKYDKVLTYNESFADNFKDGRDYIDRSDWQCYVVKDMWLDGEFKLWTGWGGNMKKYNTVNDGGYETAEQWFYENGGHQDINKNKVVRGYDVTQPGTDVTVYPTRRDREQANFRIDGMTYYSRVILWYNPQEGFENSVLQLVRSVYGPTIQAFHNLETRNTLRYEWWISVKKEDLPSYENETIDTYTVKRYRVVDGKAVYDATIEENSTAHRGTKISDMYDSDGNVINKIAFKDDANTIDPGQYQYTIDVTFGNGTTKTATSNVVTINAVSIPVTLSARQATDAEGRYAFDIDLTMRPSAASLTMPIGDTGKTVKDMMRYYVLVVGEPTAKRLNNEAVNTDGIVFTQAGTNEVRISSTDYLPAGTWYYRHEITDKDNPAVITSWKGTPPNASGLGSDLKTWTGSGENRVLAEQPRDYVAPYTFRAFLVSDDSDIDEWTQLNFDMAQANTDVIAPATEMVIYSIEMEKADENLTHDPRTTEEISDHLSGTRLLNVDKMNDRVPGNRWRTVNPIVYKRLNQLTADASIDALPVAASVVASGVDYDLYIVPEGYDVASHHSIYNNPQYEAQVPYATEGFDPSQEYTVKFYDLTLNSQYTQDMISALDGSHWDVWDATADRVYDNQVLVTYHLNGKTYVNTKGKGEPYTFSTGVNPPTIGVNSVAYTRYVDRYYHNGGVDENGVANCECGPHEKPYLEPLGHFAHAIIDFALTGIINDTKNAYVAFHVQQVTRQNPDHYNGCYPETEMEMEKWYKFSFAGTRAANGGAPVGEWANDFTASAASKIAPLSDGNGTGYVEYVDKAKNEGESPVEWTDENDWSTMAVLSSRLPLHINPISEFESEDDKEFKPGTIKAGFAAVYPLIIGDKLTIDNLKPATETNRAASMNRATANRSFSSITLLGAQATKELSDWKNAEVVTGVEDIIGDPYDDAPAEYYNLQGIRVMNPAKGQIYIVRRGANVSKVLYK